MSPNEEKLIKIIVDKGLRVVKPRRNDHTIIYEGLEQLMKEIGGNETKKLLKSLASKGYLEEKTYDSAVVCPNCESVSILSKYSCPQCESINVLKVQLLEHPLCGYIGNRSEFETDGELVCPKCTTKLGSFTKAKSKNQEDKSKIIRVIGSSYACDKCGSRFEKPTITHVCEQCAAAFTYRDAAYERLPSYELTEKTNGLTPMRFESDSLKQIEKLLTEKGYAVELDAKIKGKSGVEQHFSLAAKREGKTLLMDVSNWGKQIDIISLMGKKTDVESQSIILLDLTGNPDLEPLGKAYNITVLSGKDEGYLEKLSSLLLDAGTKGDAKRRKPFSWRGKEEKKQ
jgi:rubrerythrin